jgi:predicted nucleic acid-binding Zn ribbon protein
MTNKDIHRDEVAVGEEACKYFERYKRRCKMRDLIFFAVLSIVITAVFFGIKQTTDSERCTVKTKYLVWPDRAISKAIRTNEYRVESEVVYFFDECEKENKIIPLASIMEIEVVENVRN